MEQPPHVFADNERDSRAVVTGGSGFIGTNLVQALLDQGIEVLNIDPAAPRNPVHAACRQDVSLLDAQGLRQAIRAFAPTHVYHLGARTDLQDDDTALYAANTDGLVNLIAACKATPSIARVIFASSRLVCRIGYQPRDDRDYCPTTAYGRSKVMGEHIVREQAGGEFAWAIVRPTSIWGPWFDVPYKNFFDHVRAGRYFHPRGLRVVKSFGYVGNAVFQLRSIMAAPADRIDRRTFYIGDYEPIEVQAFAAAVAREFDGPPVKSLPTWTMKGLALAGDLLQKLGVANPPINSFRLANLCTNMLHDFADLPQITGRLPYSVDDGIRETVKWMTRPD